MDLAPLIIAMAARHGHHDHDRLRTVAADIQSASAEAPVFCGPAGDEATALGLAAIGEHESGWDPAVQDCSACSQPGRCPDRAAGLYQLVGPVALGGRRKSEVCASHGLQARLAARALRRFRGRGDLEGLFCGYATGQDMHRCKAGREIANIFWTLSRKVRLAVAYRDGCLTARWI